MKKRDITITFTMFSFLFVLLYLFFNKIWMLYFVLFFLFMALIPNPLAALLTKLWMKSASLIGWINTRILLTIIYYGVLFPVAVIYRVFKKTPPQKEDSNFIFTEKTWDRESFRKPY
ncbi:MAG: hypothetical protein R6W70_11190 [bacterium]